MPIVQASPNILRQGVICGFTLCFEPPETVVQILTGITLAQCSQNDPPSGPRHGNASSGATYNMPLQAQGGLTPYSWQILTGELPPGLSMDPSSGVISGNPTSLGTWNFSVEVTDASNYIATASFSITIVYPMTVMAPAQLPYAQDLVDYDYVLQATGGTVNLPSQPYTWTITSGSLPPGMTLTGTGLAAGTIGGTPTAGGNYTFTVKATDNNGVTASQVCSINVIGFGLTPYITNGVLFAQGILYQPDVAPTLPPAPASAHSWLFFSSTSGFYWHNSATPTSSGDATLGWAVTNSDEILALSAQEVVTPNTSTQSAVIQMGNPIPVGSGAALAAPNLSLATAVPTYPIVNGIPYIGMGGEIELPVSDLAYPQLKWIFVFVWPPGATVRPSQWAAQLMAPWPGNYPSGGMTFINWSAVLTPNAMTGSTWPKVEFVCVNSDGTVTASPYTLTNIAVAGYNPTSQVAFDMSSGNAPAPLYFSGAKPMCSFTAHLLFPASANFGGRCHVQCQILRADTSAVLFQIALDVTNPYVTFGLPVPLDSGFNINFVVTAWAVDSNGNLNTTSPPTVTVNCTLSGWETFMGTLAGKEWCQNCSSFSATVVYLPNDLWSLSIAANPPSDPRFNHAEPVLCPVVQLAANIASTPALGATTITVQPYASASGYNGISAGDTFQIDGELFVLNVKTTSLPTTVWDVTRAQDGTAAAAHASGALVVDVVNAPGGTNVICGAAPNITPSTNSVAGPPLPIGAPISYLALLISYDQIGNYNSEVPYVPGVTPQSGPILVETQNSVVASRLAGDLSNNGLNLTRNGARAMITAAAGILGYNMYGAGNSSGNAQTGIAVNPGADQVNYWIESTLGLLAVWFGMYFDNSGMVALYNSSGGLGVQLTGSGKIYLALPTSNSGPGYLYYDPSTYLVYMGH